MRHSSAYAKLSQKVGQHSKLVRETKHTANNPLKPKSLPTYQVGPEVDLFQALNIRTCGTLTWGRCREEGRRAGIGTSKWWNPYSQHHFTPSPAFARAYCPELGHTPTHSVAFLKTCLCRPHHSPNPRAGTHPPNLSGPDDCLSFLVPCPSSLPLFCLSFHFPVGH